MNITRSSITNRTPNSVPNRRRRAAVAGTVLTAGLVAVLGVGAQASAFHPTDDWDGPIDNLDDLLPGSDDDSGPILTIPAAPNQNIPNLTIPVGPADDDDDGPLLTIPIGPIQTIPNLTIPQGDDPPAEDPPAEDPPAEDPPAQDPPAEDPPAEDPPAQDPPADDPPAQDPPAEDPPAQEAPPVEVTTPADPPAATAVAPFLAITDATIDCAGLVHLTYETGADPAPAPAAEHVVMVSAVSDPSAVTSYRLLGRAVTGTFTVDLQGSTAQPYQVLVVADFEPGNADGVVLVDEAVTVVPADCPAG